MENSTIADSNPNTNPKPPKVPDFPLKSHANSHSHSTSFLLHNGFNSEFEISDIEMITIQSVTYTSLKDLLPTHNSSWYDEIPIKNPLVKHAALAYLLPMSTAPESGDKGLFGRLREQCSCQGRCFGCFAWLGDIISAIKEAFRERRGIEYYADEEEEDEDEDEDDDEKID